MNTKLLVIGGVVVFAAGFFAGNERILNPRKEADPDNNGETVVSVRTDTNGGRSGRVTAKGGRVFGGRNKRGDGGGLKSRSNDPLEDLSRILDDGDYGNRMQQLAYLLDRVGNGQFATLLEGISESPFAAEMGDEMRMIVSAWTRQDPLGALSYLKEQGGRDDLKDAAMTAWAVQDPEAAETWARASHQGNGFNRWMVGVIQGVVRVDPTSAGALIGEMPKSSERQSVLTSMLPYVMEHGDEFAANWVEGLKPDDSGLRYSSTSLKSQAAKWMATRMANENAAEAADWIESLPSANARREASEQVALQYAQSDLNAAKAWVHGLPKNTRTEAAEGVVAVMARENVGEAMTWLENLGDDVDYDGAWVDLVRNGFEQDPRTALVGALRLANGELREEYTDEYLSRWLRRDQDAALAWVQEYLDYLPEQMAQRYAGHPPPP